MSNVVVTASDETGLEVDVVLGANVRKTHQVAGGEQVELTVGGGQVLSVRAASNVAPTADLPVGSDIVAGGDDDCGDGTGRTVDEKTADDEAAASRPTEGGDTNALDLGADLFAEKE